MADFKLTARRVLDVIDDPEIATALLLEVDLSSTEPQVFPEDDSEGDDITKSYLMRRAAMVLRRQSQARRKGATNGQ